MLPRRKRALACLGAAAAVIAGLAFGCTSILDVEPVAYSDSADTGPEVANGDDDGPIARDVDASIGDADASPSVSDGGFACPDTGRGPSMVPVEVNDASFCIDSTEVTYDQFREMTVAPVLMDAPVQCGTTTSVTLACGTGTTLRTGSNPVTCMTWCAASFFCRWAGKRLCGQYPTGSIAFDAATTINDEWYVACTGGDLTGNRSYPYDGIYDPAACNGVDRSTHLGIEAGLVDAGSLPGCVGGVPGLHDMSGNAEEWEDACYVVPDGGPDGGPKYNCRARGGNYTHGGALLRCDGLGSYYTWDQRLARVGFRCCSP